MENILFGTALLLIGIVIITRCYVKAPPDTAYIISGLRAKSRILIGQGGIRIPVLERIDTLYLGQMSVDIKTGTSVPTNDFINVKVDAVAKIRVGNDPEQIYLAAKNFLNMNSAEISQDLQDSLEGNMREIVGTISLNDLNTDRDSFSDQVLNKASVDMRKLGIEILSCNIQNITDDHGLITDLGADNTAKIKKNASISKAQAERDVAIAQAQANKEANDAEVNSQLEIAQRKTDLAIKQSELKKIADIKQAEADAAYEIQKQEQSKAIQEKTVEAQIAKATKEADLKKQEVLVKQQILDAQVQKQADAERYAIEQQASADLSKRQREAEAQLYERQKEAEAKRAEAEAMKFAMEQEALGIRAKGEAEAYAIKAKGEAEAAAMEKKAEAYQKYNKIALAEMAINVMPQIAGEIAKPLSSIDKVTIFGGDGMNKISGNVPTIMAQTFATVKEATGVDLGDILKAETYDAKVNKHINVSGLPETIVQKLVAPEPVPAGPEPEAPSEEEK